MSKAILYDSTLCIGCKSCEAACAERWQLPYDDKVAAEPRLSAHKLTAIQTFGEHFSRRLCMHCAQPTCASVCPVGALHNNLRQLLRLKRVYVDRFAGGETAAQMRDMVINGLEGSKLFVITENQEKADAILRGSAEDLVFNEQHSSSDSLNVHSDIATKRSADDSSLRGGTHVYDSDDRSVGLGAGESESSHSLERRHEANAAVRLVNKDGDVIWSTTQESLGGKFRGASSDVADKITKRLLEDFERARKLAH